MFNYLLRRLLYALVALLVVVTVTFLFMHIIPGGPFQREKALPEAVKKNIEARYKLDQPLHIQYIDYLSHLVRGDLGPSYKYRGMTVNDIIRERFPVSVQLGSVSILIALLLGIPAG
ncbi:MAG TPA: ABC transporter permease, partial [Bacillota bacterium]|nr:ABC transporter permease [Bacillota bacterium]